MVTLLLWSGKTPERVAFTNPRGWEPTHPGLKIIVPIVEISGKPRADGLPGKGDDFSPMVATQHVKIASSGTLRG